jgi:UDP-glucose 4-epimerase
VVLRGELLTVYGSGEQRRCFGYVGDVTESLVRLMQAPQAVGEVVNVGNDEEVNINELAATLFTELAWLFFWSPEAF